MLGLEVAGRRWEEGRAPCLGWLGKPGSRAGQERALAGWNPSRPGCELTWPLGDTMLWPSCQRWSFKTTFLLLVSSTLPDSLPIWPSRWSWETSPPQTCIPTHPVLQSNLSLGITHISTSWGLTWITSVDGPWAQQPPQSGKHPPPLWPQPAEPQRPSEQLIPATPHLPWEAESLPPPSPTRNHSAPAVLPPESPPPHCLSSLPHVPPKGSWPTSGSGFSLS